MWVRKSVPAATTRRERVEGERVGVGEGRRRDMSNAKHPPLGLDGLNGDGNSASGDEQHSSSSAIGANFSIRGPMVRRCFPLLRSTVTWTESLSNARAVYSASYKRFFAVEIPVRGTEGPELAFSTDTTTVATGMMWEKAEPGWRLR